MIRSPFLIDRARACVSTLSKGGAACIVAGAISTPVALRAEEVEKIETPHAPDSVVSQEADQSSDAAGLEDRVAALEEENAYYKEELELLREDQEFTQREVDSVKPALSRVTGYVDVGFFYVTGDGRGIRPDLGHERFPEYEGVVADSWVFMGDPLATAINSRGEPADVTESRAVTFNPIGNEGKPSFILNNLNLQLFAGVSDDLSVNGMVDFVPRGRDSSRSDQVAFGDFVDIKLGYVDYRVPVSDLSLHVYAGKFDSVLGIEYRSQESPQRVTVTPSLICRYTCGHPLGVKARVGILDDALTLNVAATNGSHGVESFPVYDEVDSNKRKTVAGRLSYDLGVGAGLEFGVSGAIGPQDLQDDDGVTHWHYGVDGRLDLIDLVVSAEFVQGRMEGKSEPGEAPCGLAQCLKYKGAYGLVGYRVTNWLMPYARADWRSALHESGASFVYVSELWRPTAGVRLDLGTHVVIKAEAVLNRELKDVPEFDNDVFTSSLVAKF